MIFPEELDNRPFRLFVQRTCHLMNKNVKLSKIEQELANMIRAFPELGFLKRKTVNVDEHFDDADVNPFMILSAIWQVHQQLLTDSPKGIGQIVGDAFDTDVIHGEILLTVAEIYLALYLRSRDKGENLSEEDYLYHLQLILNDMDEIEMVEAEVDYPDPGNVPGIITEDMMHDIMADMIRSMHEEASTTKITVQSKISAILNKLPIEWINATAAFWQRPDVRLKRDRVKDLSAFLQSDMAAEQLRERLSESETAALAFLMQQGGFVKYHLLSKKFGDEQLDGYWWTEDPPQSVIGRLRLFGIVAVGKAQLDSRQYKIAIIPQDLRETVQNALG